MAMMIANNDWDEAVRAAFAFEHDHQHQQQQQQQKQQQQQYERKQSLSSDSKKVGSMHSIWWKRDSGDTKRNDNNNTPVSPLQQLLLPQIIYDHRDENGGLLRCLDGTILLHLLAARIDKNLASYQVYGKALCLWSDRRRHQQQKDIAAMDSGEVDKDIVPPTKKSSCSTTPTFNTTLMLDVRSGNGWTNPKALHIIPFVCSLAQYAHEHFPPTQKIERIIVFPVPHAARYMWEMVKPFLDQQLVRNLVIVPGSSERHAPPPYALLKPYVDEIMLDKMEQTRLSLFC